MVPGVVTGWTGFVFPKNRFLSIDIVLISVGTKPSDSTTQPMNKDVR